MVGQEVLQLGCRQRQAAKRLRRHDVGHRDLTQQAGDLAEIITGSQQAPPHAVHVDRRRALEDDVETGAGYALSEDPLALGEPCLVEDMRYLLELRPAEIGEEREGGDGGNDVIGYRQSAMPLGVLADRARRRCCLYLGRRRRVSDPERVHERPGQEQRDPEKHGEMERCG
jgi:hypothetical protein